MREMSKLIYVHELPAQFRLTLADNLMPVAEKLIVGITPSYRTPETGAFTLTWGNDPSLPDDAWTLEVVE